MVSFFNSFGIKAVSRSSSSPPSVRSVYSCYGLKWTLNKYKFAECVIILLLLLFRICKFSQVNWKFVVCVRPETTNAICDSRRVCDMKLKQLNAESIIFNLNCVFVWWLWRIVYVSYLRIEAWYTKRLQNHETIQSSPDSPCVLHSTVSSFTAIAKGELFRREYHLAT